MGLLADSEFRLHVREIGQRVNDRYEMGAPVTTHYHGIPLLRVHMISPREFSVIVVPKKVDPESYLEADAQLDLEPHPDEMKEEPLFLFEDSYPLASLWAFPRSDKTLGALMIMSFGKKNLYGDFLQHPSQLNEIGAEVGGFTGFDRV